MTPPPLSRRHAALRGAFALVLGVTFVAWPRITVGAAVVLFAVYGVGDALVSLFGAPRDSKGRLLRVLRVVAGTGAAAVAIAYPGPSAQLLAIVIGFYVISIGCVELIGAGVSEPGARRTAWLIAGGLLSIATGVLLCVRSNRGAVALGLVFGAYLALYGAWLVFSAATAPSRERITVRLPAP